MNIEQIKKESIKEFGSPQTQKKYTEIAERGFWNSEKVLVDKYFKRGAKILDIGCGSGRTAISLTQGGFNVTGVDITPEMIDNAKRVSKSKGLSIDYQAGDATNLEFKDNYFGGAIFANNGWAQIPGKENRQKALSEIYRVLKPGACFILVAHQRYYTGRYFFFWIIQWIRFYILKSLGFKIREIDFGDLFFVRFYSQGKEKVRQFMHMTSRGEVEKQIKKAGFKLEMRASMAQLSEEDAKAMQASLSKSFNSFKSPIFYICKK